MADDADLDQLVGELNQSSKPARAEQSPPLQTPRLEEWLEILTARGGSDLYLVAGLPP
jgi:hypothetical protein